MPRIRLEGVYCIVDFRGRKRGRDRIGDYMPPNADKWGRITMLRVPTDGNHPAGHVAGIPGILALGAAWRLLSIAANTPRPGYLVERRPDATTLQPIDDEKLADRMHITPLEWLPIAQTLLRCQFLARITLDLEFDGLLIDDRIAAELVDAGDVPLFSSPMQSGFSTSATNKPNQKEKQTKSTPADGPPGTGTFSGPAVLSDTRGKIPPASTIRAQLCELAGANGAPDHQAKLAACKLFSEYCREVLRHYDDWQPNGDREARRAPGSLWRKPDAQGRDPVPALRALRIAQLCDLVDDIALRSDVENPVAYLINRVKGLQQKLSKQETAA